MYELSGPVKIGLAPANSNKVLSGPVVIAPAGSVASGPYFDLGGPVEINNLHGGGRYIYDDDFDFDRFTGNIAHSDNIATLGYANMASQLSVTNKICHYRFGTTGTYQNTPVDSSLVAYPISTDGTAKIQFLPEGIKALTYDDADATAVSGGGTTSTWNLIDPSSSKTSCTMSAWVKWDSSVASTLWGYNHNHFTDESTSTSRKGLVAFDGFSLNVNFGTESSTPWSLSLPADDLPMTDGEWHHIMVNLATTSDHESAITRLIIDGNLLVETTNSFVRP